jgi:methylated-DNA-protein-cysteine methyltransferase-like protein
MNTPTSSIAEQIYQLVSQIPKGQVTTYGRIAKYAGLKTPRQVGWILHRNPSTDNAPCHRVVFSDGSLSGNYAFGGSDAQRKWLMSEGVEFKGEKVNMKKCVWEITSSL